MTPREARRERRAAERKAKKLDIKKARLAAPAHQPAASRHLNPHLEAHIQPRWIPELEDEFPRELQIHHNAEADRRALEARPPIFIPNPNSEALLAEARERLAQLESPLPETKIGFVSHNTSNAPTEVTASSTRSAANRRNAEHSTGPRTPLGKVASSRNSFKHGLASGQPIIPGEDPAAFDALLSALEKEHQPAAPTEELLVKELAQSYWLTQRAIRLQNECFSADGVNEKQLALFLRYQTTHERAFYKSLNTLIRLQKDRARASRGFVSHTAPQPGESLPPTPPKFGFVSQQEPELTSKGTSHPEIGPFTNTDAAA